MQNNNQIPQDSSIVDSSIHKDVKIYKGAIITKSDLRQGVSIGNDTMIDSSIVFDKTAINRRNYILKSTIGRFSYTGIGTMILSSEVGSFCSISWNVSIGGADHEHMNVSTLPEWRFELMNSGIKLGADDLNKLPCRIGNDVLISTNAVILRGVNVGHGAIIGAGAVVTKDVESYSIVAGVPARKIKMRFSEEIIKTLLEIEWWNWPIEKIAENQQLLFATKLDESSIKKLMDVYNNL